MALTPNSSSNAYATPADIIARKDVRTLSELVRDDGLAITDPASAVTFLTTNANLIAALQDASGMLETACISGERYMPTDLVNLVATPGNGAGIIKRLICDIAFHLLAERRGKYLEDTKYAYERSIQFLQQLRDGEAVLPFVESETSGTVSDMDYLQSEIDFLNLVTRNVRVWGTRGSWFVGQNPNTGGQPSGQFPPY